MQRSSPSMGTLASALAKAQGELVNPEKSLVATIRRDGPGTEQTFRYAPLSSGLDIVRKVLGQHRHSANDLHRPGRWPHQFNDGARACVRRMDRLGLASLRCQQDRETASNGSGPDLCPALCPVH